MVKHEKTSLSRRLRALRENRRRGMTLVETLVAMAILSIIIAVTCGIIMTSLGNYGRGARLAQAAQLGAGTYDFVSDRLTYAENIAIGSDAGGVCTDRLLLKDGRPVWRNGEGEHDVLSAGADDGLVVSWTTKADGALLTLSVTVSDEDGELWRREGSFRLLNLEKAGKNVAGLTGANTDAELYFNP